MQNISADSIGIVAGRGIYPLLSAEEAKRHGVSQLTVAAVKGDADPSLANLADRIEWIYAGQLSKVIRLFKKNGVKDIIFAGQIKPSKLFKGLRPDFRAFKLLARLKVRNAESIFSAIADEFVKNDLNVLPATTFLDNYLVPDGQIGKTKPNKRQLADVEFGKTIAWEVSRLNIGQTIVVKKGTVLAVEAFEGTDKAILRGANLGHGGVTVLKVAKRNQDMRFDVPCVGLNTVRSLVTAKAAALALEARKTLLLEKNSVIDALNSAKIPLIGISST